MSFDAASRGIQQDLDSFIDEQVLERCRDIGIFPVRQLRAVFDHSHIRAESTKRLRELQADIAAAQYNQVPRQAIEVERLDMRHWPGLSQARYLRECRARTEVQKDPLSPNGSGTSTVELNL